MPRWILTATTLWLAGAGCSPPIATDVSSSSGGASSSSSGANECVAPTNAEPQPVVFRVRNEAAETRWFVRWSCAFAIDLTGPDGDSLWYRAQGACAGCDGVLSDGCEPWCEDHCDGIVVRIEPGGVYEATWQGRLVDTVTLECDTCSAMCSVASAPPPGNYRATVEVHERCEASMPGVCDCQPDANGVCEIWVLADVGGEAIAVGANFPFPTDDAVDLVIAAQ